MSYFAHTHARTHTARHSSRASRGTRATRARHQTAADAVRGCARASVCCGGHAIGDKHHHQITTCHVPVQLNVGRHVWPVCVCARTEWPGRDRTNVRTGVMKRIFDLSRLLGSRFQMRQSMVDNLQTIVKAHETNPISDRIAVPFGDFIGHTQARQSDRRLRLGCLRPSATQPNPGHAVTSLYLISIIEFFGAIPCETKHTHTRAHPPPYMWRTHYGHMKYTHQHTRHACVCVCSL